MELIKELELAIKIGSTLKGKEISCTKGWLEGILKETNSLIITIESLQTNWDDAEMRAADAIAERNDLQKLVESQKEEIEKSKKSIKLAHSTLTNTDDIGTRVHYAMLHLEIALQEGDK